MYIITETRITKCSKFDNYETTKMEINFWTKYSTKASEIWSKHLKIRAREKFFLTNSNLKMQN